MFDLEQAIATWCKQMTAGGVTAPVPLDELESHLREEIATLVAAGIPGHEAFNLAASNVGTPSALHTEFRKVDAPGKSPLRLGLFVWALLLALTATALAAKRELGALLFAHTFCLTSGYLAAFLAGSFAIYYICSRRFGSLSRVEGESLRRAVSWFSRIAAMLVVAGLVLGILWTKEDLQYRLPQDPRRNTNLLEMYERFSRGEFSNRQLLLMVLIEQPRFIVTLGTSLFLVWFVWFQRTGIRKTRDMILLAVAGNIVVSLAWFGADRFSGDPFLTFYGLATSWPLATFIFLHLVILVLGFTQSPEGAVSAE